MSHPRSQRPQGTQPLCRPAQPNNRSLFPQVSFVHEMCSAIQLGQDLVLLPNPALQPLDPRLLLVPLRYTTWPPLPSGSSGITAPASGGTCSAPTAPPRRASTLPTSQSVASTTASSIPRRSSAVVLSSMVSLLMPPPWRDFRPLETTPIFQLNRAKKTDGRGCPSTTSAPHRTFKWLQAIEAPIRSSKVLFVRHQTKTRMATTQSPSSCAE